VWVSQADEIFFTCIGDNSKIQTSQPIFGGYGPPTIVGIGIRGADILERLREGDPSLQLDFETLLADDEMEGMRETEFLNRTVRSYGYGDILNFAFSGGGAGYGDPLDADPRQVVDDIVVRRVVSAWAGEEIYGVAYDSETGAVDVERTTALRANARAERLARGVDWDSFHAEWSEKAPPKAILKYYGKWPTAEPIERVVRV
jgi:acetophenone carboxylase